VEQQQAHQQLHQEQVQPKQEQQELHYHTGQEQRTVAQDMADTVGQLQVGGSKALQAPERHNLKRERPRQSCSHARQGQHMASRGRS